MSKICISQKNFNKILDLGLKNCKEKDNKLVAQTQQPSYYSTYQPTYQPTYRPKINPQRPFKHLLLTLINAKTSGSLNTQVCNSGDPLNMFSIYDYDGNLNTQNSSIYQNEKCQNPLKLNQIITNPSTQTTIQNLNHIIDSIPLKLIQPNQPIQPPGTQSIDPYKNYRITSIVISLVGNLTCSLVEPDNEMIFPSEEIALASTNNYFVEIIDHKTIIIIPNETNGFNIKDLKLYVHDNNLGVIQIFTINKTVGQTSNTTVSTNINDNSINYLLVEGVGSIPSGPYKNFPSILYIAPFQTLSTHSVLPSNNQDIPDLLFEETKIYESTIIFNIKDCILSDDIIQKESIKKIPTNIEDEENKNLLKYYNGIIYKQSDLINISESGKIKCCFTALDFWGEGRDERNHTGGYSFINLNYIDMEYNTSNVDRNNTLLRIPSRKLPIPNFLPIHNYSDTLSDVKKLCEPGSFNRIVLMGSPINGCSNTKGTDGESLYYLINKDSGIIILYGKYDDSVLQKLSLKLPNFKYVTFLNPINTKDSTICQVKEHPIIELKEDYSKIITYSPNINIFYYFNRQVDKIIVKNCSLEYVNQEEIQNDELYEYTNYQYKLENYQEESLGPECFSWRVLGGDRIEKPRDQLSSETCWGIALASCLGDRYAIKYNIKAPMPSVSWLASGVYKKDSILWKDPSSCLYDSKRGYLPTIGDPNCRPYGHVNSKNIGRNYTYYFLSPNSEKCSKTKCDNQYTKLESCYPFDRFYNNLINNDPSKIYNKYYGDIVDEKTNDFNQCSSNKDTFKLSLKFSLNGFFNFFEQYIDLSDYATNPDKNDDPLLKMGRIEIESTKNMIKKEILENGPILTSILVTPDLGNFWYNNKNITDIFRPSKIQNHNYNNPVNYMHAVCIIGWGTTIQDNEKIEYWEIRNSYGNRPSYNGYFRIEATTFENKQKAWRSLDIPSANNSGPVAIYPADIENFDKFIKKKILQYSSFPQITPVDVQCNLDADIKCMYPELPYNGQCYCNEEICKDNKKCFAHNNNYQCLVPYILYKYNKSNKLPDTKIVPLYDKNNCPIDLKLFIDKEYTTIQNLQQLILEETIPSIILILIDDLTIEKDEIIPIITNGKIKRLISNSNNLYAIQNNGNTIGPFDLTIYNKNTKTVNDLYTGITRQITRPGWLDRHGKITYESVEFKESEGLNYFKFGNREKIHEVLIIGSNKSVCNLCNTSELENRKLTESNCTYFNCTGNFIGQNCDICPPNFDNSDPTCTKCANNWSGINCNICPSNFDRENNCQGNLYESTIYSTTLPTIQPTTSPLICPSGFYCKDGTTSAVECSKGYYCPEGSTFQTSCPTGYYCPTPSTKIPCPIGTFNDKTGIIENNQCQNCLPGTYCPEGSSKAIPCPPGKYCEPEGGTAIDCPVGFYCLQNVDPKKGSSSKIACGSGKYCPTGTNFEKPCQSGSYCPTPSEKYICPAGTYSNSGATSCTSCKYGYYSTSVGATSESTCTLCPAGYYCPTTSEKISCPNGFYCPPGLNYSKPCDSDLNCVSGYPRILNCSDFSGDADFLNHSEYYDLIFFISLRFSVKNINLVHGNTRGNRLLKRSGKDDEFNLYAYFFDQDSVYGADIEITLSDRNTGLDFKYKVQQNFFSYFYPHPTITVTNLSNNVANVYEYNSSNPDQIRYFQNDYIKVATQNYAAERSTYCDYAAKVWFY